MASSSASLTPLQVRHALAVLTSFPLRRPQGKPIPVRHLEFTERLLRDYVNKPTRKAPPSKELLFEAVKSLLDPDCPPLAVRWNKEQLAMVLLEWIATVMSKDLSDQPNFFVRVHSKKGSSKDMEHETIFLKATMDDGSVEGFSIYSPSLPSPPEAKVKRSPSEAPAALGTPASSASSKSVDSSFVHEIEALGLSEPRSDGFATPRVSEEMAPRTVPRNGSTQQILPNCPPLHIADLFLMRAFYNNFIKPNLCTEEDAEALPPPEAGPSDVPPAIVDLASSGLSTPENRTPEASLPPPVPRKASNKKNSKKRPCMWPAILSSSCLRPLFFFI